MVLLPIPLDLHVLSLQLAFILSQDQTLHSINLQTTTRITADGRPISFYSNFSESKTSLCHLILGLIVLVHAPSPHHCFSENNRIKESTRNTPLSRYLGSAIISIHSMNVAPNPDFQLLEPRGRTPGALCNTIHILCTKPSQIPLNSAHFPEKGLQR